MTIRFSIVTISYNQARFLEQCIASVATQKTRDTQYIVVDPGSTDGSRTLLSKHLSMIDVLVGEPDRGPADGLNNGFKLATGEIFGYINADDRLVPDALHFVSEYFSRRPDVEVLCGAIRIIDEGGRPKVRKRTSDRFDLRRYAAGICTIGQQATFFRRGAFEKAGGFNPANRITWDGELLVDMALTGARFMTTNKILGEFRIYPESITGSNKHRERARMEHERIAEKIRSKGIPLYSPIERKLRRLFYKASISRHMGYLLAK